RRRALRIGQAGGLGRRRGRAGRHARAPLPGEEMSVSEASGTTPGPSGFLPCSVDELRSLFLFEKLSEDQLQWLCERGHVEMSEPGSVFAEGNPATCFYVLLEGTLVLSRRVGTDDVETGRTSQRGVYAGAWQAYMGDRVQQGYQGSMRVTQPSRFFVL